MKIRKVVKIVGVVTLFFAMNTIAAENSNKLNDQKIKKMMTVWMKKNNIPGLAVEVYSRGEPHSYYFGLADKDKKTPVTSKTLFEVGSFTKLFTNLLLAQEVAAGKIALSDTIANYVPDLTISSDYLSNVTFFNLATHTSGLPFGVASETKSRSQLPEYFSNWIPSSAIGSLWAYSNINTGLLGYALEASTHETINQLYRNRLLRSLGMELIGVDVPKELEGNYAQGYTEEDKPVRSSSASLFPSAGAMKASGDDMLQFLKASLQLPGVPVKISDAMRMTQTAYVKTDKMSQGLGWSIYPINKSSMHDLMNPELYGSLGPTKATTLDKKSQKFDAYALIDKTGGSEGFRSYIAVIPGRKSGVVVLANRYIPNGEIVKIGREILFSLNNE